MIQPSAPLRIAVLGGGHGAYAAAADLAEQGHEVRLWRRDAAAFAPVRESGSIRLTDSKGTRSIRLAPASAEIGAALRGAELVLVPSPATAQADIARAMAAHLESGQVVFCPPGTFGSYAMAAITRAGGAPAELSFAETGTLPYLARKHAPDEIAITMRAKHLPVGVFPAHRTDEASRRSSEQVLHVKTSPKSRDPFYDANFAHPAKDLKANTHGASSHVYPPQITHPISR